MESVYLIAGLIIGTVLGAVIFYFILKSGHVSREQFDEVNTHFIKIGSDLQNSNNKIAELENHLDSEKNTNYQQTEILTQLRLDISKISAVNDSQNKDIEKQTEINNRQAAEIKTLENEKQNLIAIKAELAAQNENLKQLLDNQKKEIEKMRELAKNEFQNLANKILEEKTEKFTIQNKENLDSILKPLGENLESFKKKVDEVYQNEARERHSLNTTIKLMMEQSDKISKEANNLASALKGQTKIQGDWGELILERILENSGLTKDREYFTQMNIKTEDGENQRPDFVLRLPGNQLVIIDSKVSLNSYEKMASSENIDEQQQYLNLHITAIKKHVDALAQKRYDQLRESFDFTIMFVPIEPAFLVAMQNEGNLWNYAYQKNIIILSPTNLIAYLKLISDVWRREDQNKNAEEIARQAGALYEKFSGFINDLLKVGKKMDDAKVDYESAMNKLVSGRGNLIKSTERLKKLGATTTKSLPESILLRADMEKTELNQELNNENEHSN